MGVQMPHEKGQFFGERVANCQVQRLSAVSCAETAETIDLTFGLWTRVAEGSTSLIVFASWRQCAYMGERIGAALRIRFNHPFVAAMRCYVKLL